MKSRVHPILWQEMTAVMSILSKTKEKKNISAEQIPNSVECLIWFRNKQKMLSVLETSSASTENFSNKMNKTYWK